MNEEYLCLVLDTIALLKEEGKKISIPIKKVSPIKKTIEANKIPSPPTATLVPPSITPAQKQLAASTMMDKIQKNLPHIAMKKEIPSPPLCCHRDARQKRSRFPKKTCKGNTRQALRC